MEQTFHDVTSIKRSLYIVVGLLETPDRVERSLRTCNNKHKHTVNVRVNRMFWVHFFLIFQTKEILRAQQVFLDVPLSGRISLVPLVTSGLSLVHVTIFNISS